MFYSLLEIDNELAQIVREKHLDLGFVLRLALIEIQYREIEAWESEKKPDTYFERVHLTRTDFFSLYQKSQENDLDPNTLLSYAFIQTLLEILKL